MRKIPFAGSRRRPKHAAHADQWSVTGNRWHGWPESIGMLHSRTSILCRSVLFIVAFTWLVPACYATKTEAVVRVRDPSLVQARPYHSDPRRGFIPEGHGPAAMRAVVGQHATLWLIRARDGSISSSTTAAPGPFQPLAGDILTAAGELRLGVAYARAVEGTPKPERPRKPLFADLDVQGVADVQVRVVTSEDINGKEIHETEIKVVKEVSRDRVMFETPPSNLIDISKRTSPSRSLGWAQLVGGLLLDSAALWIVMKANSELPEDRRGTAYAFSGVMALASVPVLALGSYMVLTPAQTERLW